jgi:dihydroflavonol-4-reductase
MTTLLTGGTGFVGSAVLRELIRAGHGVRALVRSESDRRNLDGLPVELVAGDLTDHSSLERAVKGCAILFHIAADYRLWVPDPERMHAVNVGGTGNLMRAALSAGVQRIVYTSSVATLGCRSDGSPADEKTPSSLEDMIGPYKKTKFQAEEAVRELVEREGLPAVIVNPSTPVGPRDIKPTPTGQLIVDAVSGRMPAYVDTGLNLVHVDDVARGHLLALERGRIGERYILGGEDMTLQRILTELAAITGRKPPRFRIPHQWVLPFAYFSESWARLSGKTPPRVTLDGLRMSRKKMFFSSEKAVRELGYQSRPAIEALKEAVDWFRRNGYCP